MMIEQHICCPSCGYDWFHSESGACSECGLLKSDELLSEYLDGRRPAPAECHANGWVWSLLGTFRARRLFASLARGYPPKDAQRLYFQVWLITIVCYPVVLLLTESLQVLSHDSIGTANFDGDIFRSPKLRPANVLGHSPLVSAVALATDAMLVGIVGFFIVRRLCLRKLDRFRGLAPGDRERLYAYASPLLLIFFLNWRLAKLAFVVTTMIFPNYLFGAVAWLIVIYWGYGAWPRSLDFGIIRLRRSIQLGISPDSLSRSCMRYAFCTIICTSFLSKLFIVTIYLR